MCDAVSPPLVPRGGRWLSGYRTIIDLQSRSEQIRWVRHPLGKQTEHNLLRSISNTNVQMDAPSPSYRRAMVDYRSRAEACLLSCDPDMALGADYLACNPSARCCQCPH